MEKPSAPDLQSLFEPLSEVPLEELQFLIDEAVFHQLRQDEFLFKPGEEAMHMHMLLAGSLRIYAIQNNQQREFAQLQAGDITSLLPYSRLKETRGYGQATEDCWLLSLHRDKMPQMIREQYHLTEALVHMMSSRIRQFTTYQQQNEKMMALGKLSAGLAHELNNPASAIARSSKELQEHLKQQPEHFKKVMTMRIEPEQVEGVADILFERMGEEPIRLSMMERQQGEDELEECLEEFEVENAFEIAENLLEFNFSCEELERIRTISGASNFPAVIRWVNENLITEKMVREIGDASTRIAELVSSVKNFTHMDQSQDLSPTDVHQGLDNTLQMLKHKLKKNQVELQKDFAEDLAQPLAMAGELNQVWTNLIDNAIDALEGGEDAKLTIATRQEGDFVKVNIIDNGPGIDQALQDRIWDPFYTTKDVGKGTGLGLDVVKKIIHGHRGSIKVNSKPGHTDFEVCLPLASPKSVSA